MLFADIVGFEELGRGHDVREALDMLNDIFRTFDEAAERYGVERVRTTRQGYLASCGLSVPRVDNARRAVRVRDRDGTRSSRGSAPSRARTSTSARHSTPARSRADSSGDRGWSTTCGATP